MNILSNPSHVYVGIFGDGQWTKHLDSRFRNLNLHNLSAEFSSVLLDLETNREKKLLSLNLPQRSHWRAFLGPENIRVVTNAGKYKEGWKFQLGMIKWTKKHDHH